jgi:4-oxalocrotonate tautomerase
MPFMHVRVSRPHKSPGTPDSAALADRLTELVGRHLGKKQALTALQIDAVDAAQWFIGARSLAEHGLASFHAQVQVTQGTNTKAEKAAFVADVYALMARTLGPLHPASYVGVEEMPADAWGYGGYTQERRWIAPETPETSESPLPATAATP